jgi:flagellar basal body rod protein FlgG
MLSGLYQVAGAMESISRSHEVISENLVHAATPGYRRQGLAFEAAPLPSPGESGRGPVRANRSAVSFTYLETGALQKTDNPLDAALSGSACFTVQGPNGPLYTRNGSFQMSPTGELQTRSGGYPVLAGGSPITLPTDTNSINIAGDGTISANGTVVGQLQLASFANSEGLRRVGPTLFEGGNPQAPAPDSVRVEQGFRESSNVQPVQEMVAMMLGMRYYEAAQKAMQTMTDAIAQNTRPSSS